MKLKHQTVYAIAAVRVTPGDSLSPSDVVVTITLAVDKEGRPLCDTNKRVLEGKLEVLTSLVDEFASYSIINLDLTSVAL